MWDKFRRISHFNQNDSLIVTIVSIASKTYPLAWTRDWWIFISYLYVKYLITEIRLVILAISFFFFSFYIFLSFVLMNYNIHTHWIKTRICTFAIVISTIIHHAFIAPSNLQSANNRNDFSFFVAHAHCLLVLKCIAQNRTRFTVHSILFRRFELILIRPIVGDERICSIDWI